MQEPELDCIRNELEREDTAAEVNEGEQERQECQQLLCGWEDKEPWEDFWRSIEGRERLISISTINFILLAKVTNTKTRKFWSKLFRRIKKKN